MLLNRLEKVLMNNPLRAAIQRRVEARRLLALGGRMPGDAALEIGCGRGVGTELILDLFGARRVDAFDLDSHMVELARRRLAGRGERVRLWVGDAEKISAEDNAYDAVFDFGILHHVPDWRASLREVHRVLKPGGRFYVEEVLANFIEHPLWRRIFAHPSEERFDHDGFVNALEGCGFQLVATDRVGRLFAWFVADKR